MASAPESFKATCPGCNGQITIKNMSLVGKRVECPKCKHRFVVEAPVAEPSKEDLKAKKLEAKTAPDQTSDDDKTAKGKGKKGKGKPIEAETPGDGKKKKKSSMKWLVPLALVGIAAICAAGWFVFFGGESEKPKGPAIASRPSQPRPAPAEDEEPPQGPPPSVKAATPPKGAEPKVVAPTPPPTKSAVTKQAPPPPAPKATTPPPPPAAAPVDFTTLSVAVLIDKLETPDSEKARTELLKKMEASKDDRAAALSKLREKSVAEDGSERAYVALGEAARSSNQELKAEAEKVYQEATKQRGGRPPAAIRDDPTNMLPNSTQVVLNIPVRRFLDSFISNAILRTRGAFRDEDFKARIGIPLSKMERIVLAGNKEHRQAFAVIRTYDPYDWESVREALQIRPDARKIIKGKEYYLGKVDFLTEFFGGLIPLEGLRTKAAVYRKDDRTLVYGDVKIIEDFISSPPAFRADEAVLPGESMFPGLFQNRPQPPATKSGQSPMPPPAGQPKPMTPGVVPPGAPGAAPNPGAPAAAPVAPPPTARSYLTLRPAFRRIIERAEAGKQPLLVFAEEFSRRPYSSLRTMAAALVPALEESFPFVTLLAVALNEENPLTITVAADCASEFSSVAAMRKLETRLSEAAKRELKDVFGVELAMQSGQQSSNQNPNNPRNPAAPGMMPPGAFPFPGMNPNALRPGAPRPGGRPPAGVPGFFPPGRQPNFPGRPGSSDAQAEQKRSTIDIVRQDEFITLTLTVLDKPQAVVDNKVAPQMMYLRGEMDMNSGRLRLRELTTAFGGFSHERQFAAPFAALPRPLDRLRANRPWPPDERVSWLREMLPYLGDERHSELYGALDPAKSWRDPANVKVGRVLVPQFLHPESGHYYTRLRSVDGQLAATHFVGMAGVGPDAANYPKEDKRAGIFGYDRQTKVEDVKDGLSNTIYMIQTDAALAGPWIAGGGATIRGTSEGADRDIGFPGGFVSPSYGGKEGAWILMADGSARFLAKGVSPQVFKDLCTMAGGEAGSYQLHVVGPKADEHSAKGAPTTETKLKSEAVPPAKPTP